MREPTHDEHICLSHWHRYGGAGFVRKVKSGWIIANEGLCAPIGDVPTVFKRKRDAVAYADNLMLIRAKEWRGISDAKQPCGCPEQITPEMSLRAKVLTWKDEEGRVHWLACPLLMTSGGCFDEVGAAVRLEAAYQWDMAYRAEHGRPMPISRRSWYRSAWAESLRAEARR